MPVDASLTQQEKFCRTYKLTGQPSSKKPFAHQTEALKKLHEWFKSKHNPAGGILVLPTGGGKTFTTWRFLCEAPLSEGYKVLWLAHTHHLLEQAFYSLESEVGRIIQSGTRDRQKLKVRVVSGTRGHFGPGEIQPDDDVLICTLQTVTRAHKEGHKKLEAFLKSAGEKLFVVFDEAHHSPAPSYCHFLMELRDRFSEMRLLGLTATPTHTNKTKIGWLKKLFPQEILYQVGVERLMADKILAKPVFETAPTRIQPEINEQQYRQWLRDFREIPEEIITKLAEDKERNRLIASTYVANKEKYGKTIIFADRWFQCEALKGFIEKISDQQGKKLKVDVVYSHIDAEPGSADARNKRTEDDNKRILRKFKNNEIDVLINVRMLTEGTDIPDVKTVFLTRQTTSKILLTQMVGRALRGSAVVSGKDTAYVVSFVDDWQHAIVWADWKLEDGGTSDDPGGSTEPLPMHLISIDLLRRLISQADVGITTNPGPFLDYMPVGWYRVEVETVKEGSEDSEVVYRLILVFEKEKECYEKLIESLQSRFLELEAFIEPDIKFDNHQQWLEELQAKFFAYKEHIGGNLLTNLFYIIQHIAQNDGDLPAWFEFKQRDEHNLDSLAHEFVHRSISSIEKNTQLQQEYAREDRYWQAIYQNYNYFWSDYIACEWKILNKDSLVPVYTGSNPKSTDLPEEVKKRIKERDGNRCLCCGATKFLEIDHVKPKYQDVDHAEENLQTLCKTCNQRKGTQEISFQENKTPLSSKPKTFHNFEVPKSVKIDSMKEWEEFLCRSINFLYKCQAVESVKIGREGYFAFKWIVNLHIGNDPGWAITWLHHLLPQIQKVRHRGTQLKSPESISVRTITCERTIYSAP